VRGTIFDSAMRPVVIVLLDLASDAGSRFFQAPILCRPDFLFLQAAMEPLDVAVALRVVIGRATMGDAQPPECFQETRRGELGSLSVVSVTFASRLPAGSCSSTAFSTAASASSVQQRWERFQPTISRVQQSITLTR
jgi:hypothetical protein